VDAGVIERRALAAAQAVATDGGLRCEQAEVT
jgi:hypothetical protein